MPDDLEFYLDPLPPRDRVHSIASKVGLSPDIADDYYKLTNVESGHNANVRNSSKGAQGFGQVMPDVKGGTTRTVGGRRYNLKNPDENIEAGIRYFAEGGSDPIARRLHYFGGPGARKHYERTGKIPNISDGNMTAAQYVKATGAPQRTRPQGSVENYLDPTPTKPAKSSVEDYLDPVETVAPKSQPSAEQALLNIMGEVNKKTARMERQAAQRPVRPIAPASNDPFALLKAVNAQPVPASPDDALREQAMANTKSLTFNPVTLARTVAGAARRGMGAQVDTEVEEEFQRLKAAQGRANTPEMIEARKGYGALQPLPGQVNPRAVIQPLAKTAAGLMKLAAGAWDIGGILPENEISKYLRTKGQFMEEAASLPPLNAAGEEIKRKLPEKLVGAVADTGLSIAEIVLLKKASGLPLGRLLALETALKSSDEPADKRAAKVAESYAMGRVLDTHLSRPTSALLFGGPTAAREGQSYLNDQTSLEDAILQTAVQTGVGGVMGGKPKGERNARPETTTKTIAPEDGTMPETQPVSPLSASSTLPSDPTTVRSLDVPIEQPQRFYHKDWGEVVELSDQSGARRRRVKVAEVDDPNAIHYPKRADLSGRGNQRLVPIKTAEQPTEPAATASPNVPLSEGVQSPSAPAERVAYLERKLDDMGAAGATLQNTSPERLAAITDVRKDLEKLRTDVSVQPDRIQAGDRIVQRSSKQAAGFEGDVISVGRVNLKVRGFYDPGGGQKLIEQSRTIPRAEVDEIYRPKEQPSTSSVAAGAQLPTVGMSARPETKSESRKETTNESVEPRGAKPTADTSTREGLGAASSEPSSTAAKREKVTADREARGEEPIPKPERKPDEQLLADAKTANERDPNEPLRIVDQVLNGKKGAMSDTETVQVDLHVQELKNKYDAVNKELVSAKDAETIKDLTEKSDAMEREMRASEEAFAQSGTEKGRALRAQRFEIDNDFRPLTMIAKRIKAKGDKLLTTEERELIKTQAQQIVEWEAKLKTANTRIEEMEAERAVGRIKRDVAKETRKQTRGAKKQSLDDEAANLKDLIAQAWKKQKGGDSTIQPLMGLGKFDPEGEITKLVLQLVRNRVKANVGLKSEALIDQIYGLVRDITDLDKRQVRDMISGYGRVRGTRSELQKQIDTLKSELYKLSSEEDIQAGVRSPRSEGPRRREQYGAKEGPRRSEASELPMEGPRLSDARRVPLQGPSLSEGVGRRQGPRIQDAPFVGPRRSDVRRLRAEGPRITDAPKLGPRDTAPSLRKRLEAQIDVLQKKIDTGDFSKTERRGPIVYDRQTLAIQKRLETIKREYSKANYRATRGRFGMVTDELAKAANVPKTLKSMGDVSAMFRQGGFYAITHPVEGLAKPTRDMLRSFTEAGYRNVENAIKNDSDFENSRRDGVEYTGVDKTDPNLSHREESYFGGETIDLLATGKYNPLRAVKGVKNFSERTFISFLDSQRLHMYKTMKEGLTDPGIIRRTLGQKAVTRATSPQDFKNIAKLINIGTGRGDIPKFLGGNKAAPVLNIGIFAPRLIASRVQLLNNMFNPVKMARMSPSSRNQMIADNVKFLAATAVVFKLAEAAGGTVNRDPDDADFLKIRFGDTTYDTLTGLQQPLRYIINMTRAATGGETYSGKDAGEMSKRFARSKVAPGVPAIGVDYLAGEDFEGRPFSLKRELIGSREKLYTDSQFSPLPAQDFVQAMQEEGLIKGFVKATPAVTGVGVQSYPERPDKPTTKAEKLARKFVGENIPHKIRTDEQIETSRKVSDLKARSRKGEDVKQELANLEGQIRGKQAKAILGAVNKTRFQEDFNRLSPKQAAIVYSVATEAERAEVKDILERKSLAIADMTDAEQADMDRRLKALGMTLDTGPQRQRPQKPQEAQKAQRAQRSGYSFPN